MNCKRTVKLGGIVHTEGRIIAIGGSAAVTLPKCWLDEQKLRVGDSVVKIDNGILLMIMTKPRVCGGKKA